MEGKILLWVTVAMMLITVLVGILSRRIRFDLVVVAAAIIGQILAIYGLLAHHSEATETGHIFFALTIVLGIVLAKGRPLLYLATLAAFIALVTREIFQGCMFYSLENSVSLIPDLGDSGGPFYLICFLAGLTRIFLYKI